MSDEAEHEPAQEPAPTAFPAVAPVTAREPLHESLFAQPVAEPAPGAPLFAEQQSWGFTPRPKAEPARLRKWEALWLTLATGTSLLFAPIGFVAAILSPMVFDPHQNLMNPAAWIAFFLIISFWMVCIAAPYGAWVAYLRRLHMLTWLVMAAPLVWVAAVVASVSFLPG